MSKLSKESNALYSACLQATVDADEKLAKVFGQRELEAFADRKEQKLVPLVQELTDHQLFRSLKQQGLVSWIIRPRDLAKSISTLSEAERMVYCNVEDANITGVWIKKIKQMTQIAPNDVQKAIGKLEKLNLIKGIKSVKSPAQRIYMLYHLAPSDDVTGGSFFDAGDLDESLVEELSNLIIFRVRHESWFDSKRRTKPDQSPIDVDNDQATQSRGKRKRDVIDIEDTEPPSKKRSKGRGVEPDVVLQLAYPAASRKYPTASDVHTFVTTSNAIRPGKAGSLTIPEVQGLIDMLVWDGKLEKVGGGYRTVRGVNFKPPGAFEFDNVEDANGNGLTETPCGRCPVFDLCHEGGPVNAANCSYYGNWVKA